MTIRNIDDKIVLDDAQKGKLSNIIEKSINQTLGLLNAFGKGDDSKRAMENELIGTLESMTYQELLNRVEKFIDYRAIQLLVVVDKKLFEEEINKQIDSFVKRYGSRVNCLFKAMVVTMFYFILFNYMISKSDYKDFFFNIYIQSGLSFLIYFGLYKLARFIEINSLKEEAKIIFGLKSKK